MGPGFIFMLNIVKLIAFMLIVVMLNVVKLSVVAPEMGPGWKGEALHPSL
jgi:hypothetical protein